MNSIPAGKISETLLEFAEPVLQQLPDRHSKSELETVIRVCANVWNACVLDQWQKTTEFTDTLIRLLGPGFANDRAVLNALIARKQHLYGGDPRAVTNVAIVVRNGEFRLQTEARADPDAIERTGVTHY